MTPHWISLLGDFEFGEGGVVFRGGTVSDQNGREVVNVGNLLSDNWFTGGTLSADIQFIGATNDSACEFIVNYDPFAQRLLTAGIGRYTLATIREFSTVGAFPGEPGQGAQPPNPPQILGFAGPRSQIRPDRKYRLVVDVQGSLLRISIDGVVLLLKRLPSPVPGGQVGLWCFGKSDIQVSDFRASTEKPRAFVVMQFSPPFDEMYAEVIKPVCERLGVEALRADESAGPGVIIADIEREIARSSLVIAEITPDNGNVFFEVGLAFAGGKPTILMANSDRKLPFDVSPFRTIMYRDSIAGKRYVEVQLERFIGAILGR